MKRHIVEAVQPQFPTPSIPSFGERQAERVYRDRPGAYGLLFQEQRLVCVRTPTGLYLPGGGVDSGEQLEEALVRECREETGLVVEGLKALCRAKQRVVDVQGQGWEKDCHYFLAEVRASEEAVLARPSEADHEVVRLALPEACRQLKLEADRWAIEQFAGQVAQRVIGQRSE